MSKMSYFNDAMYLFEERHQEMINFLEKFHTLSQSQNNSDFSLLERDEIKIIKSNILLMQYNIVESSFLELYKILYNFLKSCSLSLDQLNKNFSYNIFSLIKRSAQRKHQALQTTLLNTQSNLNFSKCTMSLCFDLDEEEKKFLVNGNLDGKKIKDFFKEFGMDISQLEALDLSPLRTLKDKRQLLAHGGSSFSDVGGEISWDTLISNSSLIESLFNSSKQILENFCNELSVQMSSNMAS